MLPLSFVRSSREWPAPSFRMNRKKSNCRLLSVMHSSNTLFMRAFVQPSSFVLPFSIHNSKLCKIILMKDNRWRQRRSLYDSDFESTCSWHTVNVVCDVYWKRLHLESTNAIRFHQPHAEFTTFLKFLWKTTDPITIYSSFIRSQWQRWHSTQLKVNEKWNISIFDTCV